MRQHLGINLAVLLCLSIGAGLMGSLPAFAVSTAEKSLQASLENAHPSVRNIKVTARSSVMTSALNSYINETIDYLLDERIHFSNIQREIHPSGLYQSGNVEREIDIEAIWLWSIDKLRQYAILSSGDWPDVSYPQSQAEALQPPTIQAAISDQVSASLQINTGDILRDQNNYQYLITGIIHVNDQTSDVWWQDSSPYSVTIEPGLNEDQVIVPLLIHHQSMRNYLPGAANEWRYILKPGEINQGNAEIVEIDLINLKNRLTTNQATLTSGLPDLVQDFRQDLSTSRMVIYLLSIQAFLFVIFTLLVMANFMVRSSQSEIATFKSRGASRFQIVLTYAIQNLILALVAGFLFGPLISWMSLSIWRSLSSDGGLLVFTVESLYLSLTAAFIGWLAIVIAIIFASKTNVIAWQQATSRQDQRNTWQRNYLDLFILIIGGLLFWQLSSSGSFVMQRIRGSNYADPLLLIGPSLLFIAVAMIYLRIFPLLLQFLLNLFNSGRGIILPVGLTRIGRNPQQFNWIVLLISLASGLILFAFEYSSSLVATQEQIAVYKAGANLRLDGSKVPPSYIDEIVELLPTSQVLRGSLQDKSGKGTTLLAVHPDTLVEVTEYPTGMTNLTIGIIMEAISQSPIDLNGQLTEGSGSSSAEISNTSRAIPAVFSYGALPRERKIGDHQVLYMAGNAIEFVIRGTIADFPTLSNSFVIVNADNLEAVIGNLTLPYTGDREYWISLDEQTHEQLVSFPTINNAIIGDSTKFLNIIRNHVMTLGTVRAFALNGLVLSIISMLGLAISNYFSFHQREYEFGILRAFGLSNFQSNLLMVGEGLLTLGIGLAAGIILGFSLTILMRPYISIAVSRTLPGMTVHQIDVNWWNVAGIIGVLLGVYLIVLTIIMIALWKSNVSQVLKTGVE